MRRGQAPEIEVSAPARQPSTNAEVAAHLREYASRDPMTGWRTFGWPTDGCSYEQHIRFVEHRNKQWLGGTAGDFQRFILDYAEKLETEP